jgi:peptidoglycan/LPS O-acetylase OafA/YrhL
VKASSLCFQAAVVFVIAGMLWGISMAISENHAAFPAHAHLNLLGWASLFLFGVYYRLHPALEKGRLTLLQVWSWIVGTAVLVAGVGLISTGHPGAEPIAAIGSLIALAAMLLFGWTVFRTENLKVRGPVIAPAE